MNSDEHSGLSILPIEEAMLAGLYKTPNGLQQTLRYDSLSHVPILSAKHDPRMKIPSRQDSLCLNGAGSSSVLNRILIDN